MSSAADGKRKKRSRTTGTNSEQPPLNTESYDSSNGNSANKNDADAVTTHHDDDAHNSSLHQEDLVHEKMAKKKKQKPTISIEVEDTNGGRASLSVFESAMADFEKQASEDIMRELVGDANNADTTEAQDEGVVEGNAKYSKSVEKTSKMSKLVPDWIRKANFIPTDAYLPLEKANVPQQILTNLKRMGVDKLFPVQTEVIPRIMLGARQQQMVVEDLCVCAPTGSGKTLAYAVPIVSLLLPRIVQRLRALVLLPTRDLALQVKSVFDSLCHKTNIKVSVVLGQQSFAQEQASLVDAITSESLIDVLIATPGRLVDHLRETKGFTLEHLQYLVIDEADRLLMQSYQEWLPNVLKAAHREDASVPHLISETRLDLCPSTIRAQLSGIPVFHSTTERPLQKLLFSATLTQNAQKITPLRLQNPVFFTFAGASETVRYKLPETLKEHMLVCAAEQKPVALYHLLQQSHVRDCTTLCFTSSVESTHRLFLLLKFLGLGEDVAEFSSQLPSQKRAEILENFKSQKVKMLICSDVTARGIDIEDIVNVVNYDVPAHLKTYVHRVGRTARAGREGNAYTLLRKEEVYHFKKMLSKAQKKRLQDVSYSADDLKQYETQYSNALSELKKAVEKEKHGLAASSAKEESHQTEAMFRVTRAQLVSNFLKQA